MSVDSDEVSRRCRRARLAWEKLRREACEDSGVESRELDEHTGVFIPESDIEILDELGDSPLTPQGFEEFLDRSPVLKNWLGGMCGKAGIDSDEPEQLRECVRNFGEAYMDETVEGALTNRSLDLVAGTL